MAARLNVELTGGRIVVSSSVPAEKAEAISDVPTSSLDERTERLMAEQAEERIIDAIMCERSYKVGPSAWTLEAVIDCAINDGELTNLSQRLYAITSAKDKYERDCQVDALIDWLRVQVKQQVPQRIFEAEAKEIAEEALGDELAAKERAAGLA